MSERETIAFKIQNVLSKHLSNECQCDGLGPASFEIADAVLQRAAELVKALEPFVTGAAHTRVFLTSREKMHPDGVAIFDEDVTRARTAVARHKERTK